ncbi:hypothetical protein J6590_086891 [Homalodisca vitripennis]|nr:hypothetical protein J6590_086891 [Homalodisca vitripennis]
MSLVFKMNTKKRGARRPERHKKARTKRCTLAREQLDSIPSDEEFDRTRCLFVTPPNRSPGTPIKDDHLLVRPCTLAEIKTWELPDMLKRNVSCHSLDSKGYPSNLWESCNVSDKDSVEGDCDTDEMLFHSPKHEAFITSSPNSSHNSTIDIDVFLSPLPLTPGRDLEARVAKMSPLFRYRESPECVFSDLSPLRTPPTPGSWLDVLEDQED